jgi:hypothetical protein
MQQQQQQQQQEEKQAEQGQEGAQAYEGQQAGPICSGTATARQEFSGHCKNDWEDEAQMGAKGCLKQGGRSPRAMCSQVLSPPGSKAGHAGVAWTAWGARVRS